MAVGRCGYGGPGGFAAPEPDPCVLDSGRGSCVQGACIHETVRVALSGSLQSELITSLTDRERAQSIRMRSLTCKHGQSPSK